MIIVRVYDVTAQKPGRRGQIKNSFSTEAGGFQLALLSCYKHF